MLLGCIGNDEYGKKLRTELDKVDVHSILEVTDKHPTSRCGVVIHEKERCLIPEILASKHLSEEFVNKNKVKIKIYLGEF